MSGEIATVGEAFRAQARRTPAAAFLEVLPRTAVYYALEARSYSYGEIWREVERCAQRYRAAGYVSGQRVGLMLENRPSFYVHWFALNLLGVSVVPLSVELRVADLAHLLGHSEICLAVCRPASAALLQVAARHAGVQLALASDEDERVPAAAGWAAASLGVGRDAECALLYTSGTTGLPKGCVLTNEYFLRAGQWYNNIGGLCALRPGAERLLTPLPLTHMNAMAFSSMAMLDCGGTIIALDRFHPSTWWESVRAARATIVHYLGVMPALLLAAPPSAADRDHQVRFGFGAGVEKTLHAAFEARFGFPLLEAWAMTETGAGAVVIANEEPRHVGTACFGRPGPEVVVRVVDDAGVEATAGEPGELLVRAAGANPRAGFFHSYWKDAAATEEAWAGGWFHTGDVVRRDAHGYLYFVDRKKNVIRRSGENISAAEVEAVLRLIPWVANVGVAAVPDAMRGDEVMACVEPAHSVAESERASLAEALVRFCLERLAYFKAPGYVVFVERLPLTATQKIARAELRALARASMTGPECVDTRALKRRG